MNVSEAMRQITNDKKLRARISTWRSGFFVYVADDGIVKNHCNENYLLKTESLQSNDWEVFKQEKIEKLIPNTVYNCYGKLDSGLVKIGDKFYTVTEIDEDKIDSLAPFSKIS